ncbi:MAG: MFS transporter [Acutalibacteraceae bacterium]|nr:MFS transporter [Acutalibacteraceae bacterium]
MESKIQAKKENKIIFICWLAYTAAYVGRLNFNASIVAIISDLGVTKADAGLVSSFFFFAYGAGQLVNGILSKRYNARVMIFISLICSAVFNLLMPLTGSISAMKFIWMGNGIVQSVLWSTLIKTLSDYVSDKKLPKAIVAMSTTVALGTLVAYGISSLSVNFGTWQAVFYIASIVLIISAFIWITLFGNAPEKLEQAEAVKGEKIKTPGIVLLALFITAFAGIANGFIKDGINTWVPSVLYEEFGVSQSFSILLTLFLPMVSTMGAAIAKKIHEKIPSHACMNFIFYAFSALLCGGILLSLKIHSIVAVMLCFVCVACGMAMINNVITSMFALDYRRLLNAGFAAGLLNTFCYVGSTVTSYSLGAVAQSSGWNAVFLIMLGVCGCAAAICLIGIISENKMKVKQNDKI